MRCLAYPVKVITPIKAPYTYAVYAGEVRREWETRGMKEFLEHLDAAFMRRCIKVEDREVCGPFMHGATVYGRLKQSIGCERGKPCPPLLRTSIVGMVCERVLPHTQALKTTKGRQTVLNFEIVPPETRCWLLTLHPLPPLRTVFSVGGWRNKGWGLVELDATRPTEAEC